MQKYDIIVFGPYPNSDIIKDGFVQRVAAIDSLIENKKRLYITMSFKKNLFKKTELKRINENTEQVHINFTKLFLFIVPILKASKIYIHTLINVVGLIPYLPLLKSKDIFFDVHGLLPEELYYRNMFKKAIFYNAIEKIFFSFTSNISVIFVTNSMKNYISSKYPKSSFKPYVVPIYPANSLKYDNSNHTGSDLSLQYNIKEGDVVFIYSGSTHKWQNIPMMLEKIKKLSQNKSYKFFILSGEIHKFHELLKQHELMSVENVILLSVHPLELHKFYKIAHYGFLLRDEHIINEVACPTKAVEYMFYGIIPIVKSPKIGDFFELNYEFIHIDDLDMNVMPRKSNINPRIIKDLITANQTQDLQLELNK